MKYLIFAALFVFVSCGLEPRHIAPPKDLIPQDSMVIILHDLSIMESYIHQKYIQLERYALLLRRSGDSLLLDFGISRERYERSIDYYGHNPEIFMQIYDSVILKLGDGKLTPSAYEALDRDLQNYNNN